MATWQLQTAKNKLSEVVDATAKEGPQVITRRGVNTAVVMSYDQYRQLTGKRKSAKQVLLSAAGIGDELDLSRDKSVTGRASEPLQW